MSTVFPPGVQLAARYRVLRLRETRRVSALFDAEELVTQRRVALKWLRFSSATDQALHELSAGARAACQLHHPNLARVHDVAVEGSAMFVVSELLQGEALQALLAPHALPLHARLRVLVDAMNAINAAHARGVFHGGLHPGNVFLHGEHADWTMLPPTVKVTDIGASVSCMPESLAHTADKSALGAHAYLDHDQLCATASADARSDVYAFGVMLFQALTARMPYVGISPVELAVQMATTPAPAPQTFAERVPDALDRLVRRCLHKARDERPESLVELARETGAFAEEYAARELLAAQSHAMHTRKLLPNVVQPERAPFDARASDDAAATLEPAIHARGMPSIVTTRVMQQVVEPHLRQQLLAAQQQRQAFSAQAERPTVDLPAPRPTPAPEAPLASAQAPLAAATSAHPPLPPATSAGATLAPGTEASFPHPPPLPTLRDTQRVPVLLDVPLVRRREPSTPPPGPRHTPVPSAQAPTLERGTLPPVLDVYAARSAATERFAVQRPGPNEARPLAHPQRLGARLSSALRRRPTPRVAALVVGGAATLAVAIAMVVAAPSGRAGVPPPLPNLTVLPLRRLAPEVDAQSASERVQVSPWVAPAGEAHDVSSRDAEARDSSVVDESSHARRAHRTRTREAARALKKGATQSDADAFLVGQPPTRDEF